MNELKILRGGDIGLYIDGEELFGVVAFTATEKTESHAIYEYLSASPYDAVQQASAYEIRLSVLSLFDRQIAERCRFTLSVVEGDTRYCYEHCRVAEKRREAKENHNVGYTYLIQADKLVKQVKRDD